MTNQKLILETLLESPKTTGEIAKVLGKINKNGYGKYNVVADDLKKLKELGFISSKIEKQKGVRGPSPTVYNINYDVKTIIDILNSHKSLLISLQKNDKIIDLIIEKQKKNIIYNFPFDFEFLISTVYNVDITQSKLQNVQEIEKIINSALVDDFIKKTKLSPTFFKFFLVNNTPKTLRVLSFSSSIIDKDSRLCDDFSDILQEDGDDYIEHFKKYSLEELYTLIRHLSDCFFKSCVITDFIEDVSNQKSLDFIHYEIDPSNSENKKLRDKLYDELTKII